jgi:hypothetical protein
MRARQQRYFLRRLDDDRAAVSLCRLLRSPQIKSDQIVQLPRIAMAVRRGRRQLSTARTRRW